MLGTIRLTCWSGVFVAVASVSVLAHLTPTKSLPEADAVLRDSPEHVQVWFTQDPDPAVSLLTLDGPTGAIEIGEVEIAAGKSLKAAVLRQLAPGSYTLKWRTAGDDGHIRRGGVAFSVRAAD